MSKGIKIKQLSTFTAGLIVVVHLLFPHHHHKLLHYCTHLHSENAICHHHHSSENNSHSVTCHSLNELTVSKKQQNNDDNKTQSKDVKKQATYCKSDLHNSNTTTKTLKFCNTNQKLTEQLTQKLLHFRAPPIS